MVQLTPVLKSATAVTYGTVDNSTNSQQLQWHMVQLTTVLTVSNCS